MVLTATQVTAFFEAANQMAIPHETRLQLQSEGMSDPNDLVDFDEDSIKSISENLRRPGGRVPDTTPGAAVGATVPASPFVFGAKSQIRLAAACDLVRYYQMVGRELTVNNIKWDPVIKNFRDQWKALKDRRKEDEVQVPKISKSLPVMKWSESFTDFLHRVIGIRMIPLAYVIRENVVPNRQIPQLAPNSPHSIEHGSIEEEMIEFVSHSHPLFKNDSASVCYYLEEATRSTQYASSIKPYQRNKNGRDAWLAIVRQYAGKDKWDKEIKLQDDFLHTSQWKGQSNFTLGQFISQHRAAYVSMEQCAEHVDFQLPNGQTRVKYLLDAIVCSDAGLQAAMAMIRNDDRPDGKLNTFEDAATYLLQYDPVAKRKSSKKDLSASVAEATAEVSSSSGSGKPAIGKTGVHFRFYAPAEWKKLTQAQKDEVIEYRRGQKRPKKKQKLGGKEDTRTLVSQLVAKEVEKAKKAIEEKEKSDREVRSYIMSLFQEAQPSSNGVAGSATAAPVSTSTSSVNSGSSNPSSSLKSILKKAKGHS